MGKKQQLVCSSCEQVVSHSDKLCPFCGSILESKAWQNGGQKPSGLQLTASYLKLIVLATFGLIAIFFLAWIACLVILGLAFGSLAFLATIVRRTNATYQHMMGNAQRSGIGGILLLVVIVVFLLLLLWGAHRFWQKRPPK